MGLDWVVIRKEIDGAYVDPTVQLGAKRADSSDPEVTRILRGVFAGSVAAAEEQMACDAAEITRKREARERTLLGRWLGRFKAEEVCERPVILDMTFEEFVQVLARKDPPPLVILHAPECVDGVPLEWNNAAEFYYGLRAKHLEAGHNAVTAYGEAQGVIATEELYGDLESEPEITAMADRLHRLLEDYRAATHEPDDWSVTVYEDAIRWLRFWAPHGFRIAADF